jgi:endoglucanase
MNVNMRFFYTLLHSILLFSACPALLAQDPISPHIHVNQLGYPENEQKLILVNSPIARPFSLLDIKTNTSIYSGMLKLAEARDAASGSNVWAADISVVNSSGEYALSIPGLGKSYPFPITAAPYNTLSYLVMNSFYFMRCGTALDKVNTGNWARAACHTADGIISAPTADQIERIDATGGWHEGSEFGKYSISGAFAAGILLTLHEKYPRFFPDSTLKIPESGNGVPDILDEVRWELEWLLKMQEDNGGIRHKLTGLTTVNDKSPLEDQSKRYLYHPSNNATALCSAVFAKASRVYSPYDATFSIRCQKASLAAWRYLETTEQADGFKNPEGTLTKAYDDGDDSDERLWAAVELFLTTKDARFLEIVNALAERRIPFISASGYWGNVMPLATASILSASSNIIGEALQKDALTDITALAASIAQKSVQDGYRLSVHENEFIWGSNRSVVQNTIILIMADWFTPTPRFKQAAYNQLHYLLGRNPLSMCYITGVGSQSPQNPLHPESMFDNSKEPLPGLMVGGPNQFLNDSVLKRHFNTSSPPATTYIDSSESFSSNETCIAWNAALALVLAYFYQ